MSKRHRNRFERSPRDLYQTPLKTAAALILHLKAAGVRTFAEPCAGEGDLIRHLEGTGLRCVQSGDIATGQDALAVAQFPAAVITNPPFARAVLLPLIDHFLKAAPFSWLLLPADFAHVAYARPYLPHCTDIVSAGRAAWFGGSGTENVAWYRFDREHTAGPVFHNGAPSGAVICDRCHRPFRATRTDAKFCGDRCRQAARRARLAVT